MIVMHPLDAPILTWRYLGTRRQALKFWFKLLHPAFINGKWYKPWCGWIRFWGARPWK